MPTKAEVLFESLQEPSALMSLIGKAEDTDLDCKQWRGDEDGKRLMLAKAVCGFANGDGGIVLLGMRADTRGDEPDLIKETAFFPAPEEVKAKALAIVQADIEPLVQGIRASAVVMDGAGNGVVAILVPSSDGLPHRSKRDWKFHLRSGSSTQNMPLTVLADRFGRRPHSVLTVSVSEPTYRVNPGMSDGSWRSFDMYVSNSGKGVARFPALFLQPSTRLQRNAYGIPLWAEEGTGSMGLSYRGGPKDVIYPDEVRKVITLYHRACNLESGIADFDELRIACKAVCLDSPTTDSEVIVEGASAVDVRRS